MRSVTLGSLTVSTLSYGHEVKNSPVSIGRHYVLCKPLTGRATFRAGQEQFQASPSCGILLAANGQYNLSSSADCDQLLIKIPATRVEHIAHQAFGQQPEQPPVFEPRIPLETAAGTQLNHLITGLVRLLPQHPRQQADTRWLTHYEDNLILHLLYHHPNSIRKQAEARQQAADHERLRQFRAAEAVIASRLSEPLSVDDIAREAGVTTRRLNDLFRQYSQTPVMTTLRNKRLDAAYKQLSSSSTVSVTEVAFNCGFSHLGRFAAYYQRRFNELPNATQRAHSTRPQPGQVLAKPGLKAQ